jgi:hypothetical protein
MSNSKPSFLKVDKNKKGGFIVTTEKQIIANRENAKKSTGPKDSSLTKLNALKYGILSQEIILKGERKKELEELGKGIRQELAPQGELELVLVDRIVTSIWRLKRALRVETALVSYEYDDGLYDNWNNKPRDERLATTDMLTGDNIEKVLRYETTMERQIFRTLHELMRIQSSRKGEKPPAPIALDLDLNKE